MNVCRNCETPHEDETRFCTVCGTNLLSPVTTQTRAVETLSPKAELIAGHYRVIEQIGEGGFGVTYLVKHEQLHRRAFMKVLRERDATPEAFERLQREFSLMSRLDHPAIARNFDVGRLPDGRPYLVTEFVDGATLDSVLASRGRFTVNEALDVALSLARGLGCAHDAGILHRDVKPQNIMIPGGRDAPRFDSAKLVDFGAFGELLVNDSDQRFTQAGMFFGTPRYMSPEQIQALPQSPATDVYGLALVLYEMIYGDVPLTERGRTSAPSVLLRILKEQITLPDDPDVPRELRDLIERSLAKDPAARPRDGAAFAALLEQIRGGATSASHPVLAARSTTVTVGATATGWFTTETPARSKSRAPLYVAVGVALVVVAGLCALLLPASAIKSALHALPWIATGLALSIAGVIGGRSVRRLAHAKMHDVEIDAERLLLGLRTRRALSDTLQIEVTRIIARCRDLDERLLGVTIMKMIHEYDNANASNERQAALMNVATLLEKLRGRLSPWYARFEKQLALTTSAIGIASGVITVVAGIFKLAQGKP